MVKLYRILAPFSQNIPKNVTYFILLKQHLHIASEEKSYWIYIEALSEFVTSITTSMYLLFGFVCFLPFIYRSSLIFAFSFSLG